MTDDRWARVQAHSVSVAMIDPDRADRWVTERIAYREDEVDQWASPRQTIERGYGDCEDLAILKRAILIAGGVPRDRVFLVLAHDTIQRRDHAFLIVHTDRWYILNGQGAEPAARLADYRPILAMNHERTWIFGRVAP